MTGAMTFAFGAGLLATVNPCGFVMLPGFIGMQLGTAEEAGDRTLLSRCAQGLGLGLVLSGAFSAVLVLAGRLRARLWLCGFHAGGRLPGEALGLLWGAVDFEAEVLRPYGNWVRNGLAGRKRTHDCALEVGLRGVGQAITASDEWSQPSLATEQPLQSTICLGAAPAASS
jgi:hypothetical protein